MDKYEDDKETSEVIYGAITMGELWRFGILDRRSKAISKDLHTYRVPEDFERLFLVILGILQTL